MPSRKPIFERLMAKVVKTDDCWLWAGAVANSGYGRIGTGLSKRTGQVHRIAYELFIGQIAPGLHIDHLCCNRLCVNPEHLEAVTQAENNRRAWVTRRPSHCKRGHEFTPQNTMTIASGGRNCRACRNLRARELRAERKVSA